MNPQNPSTLPLLLLTLGLLLSPSLSLRDTVSLRSGIRGIGCRPVPAFCCRSDTSCRVAYNLRARWFTELDSMPDEPTCTRICDRHLEKCNSACECVSTFREARAGTTCKCMRIDRSLVIRAGCLRACENARERCLTGCLEGIRCPANGTTVVNWRQNIGGVCRRFCRPDSCPADDIITPA